MGGPQKVLSRQMFVLEGYLKGGPHKVLSRQMFVLEG